MLPKIMVKRKKRLIIFSILGVFTLLEIIAFKLKTLGPITFLIFWLASVASPWLNTNEFITQGEGYGFRIEMTKEETIEVLEKNYSNQITIEEQSLGKQQMKFSKLNLNSKHLDLLLNSDLWHLMLNENGKGFYLEFTEGKLSSINYYHQRYELP